MIKDNHTALSDFILLGYSEFPVLQVLLFVVFLFIYVGIILGNGLTIYVTLTDAALDSPMYFFLRNLSFLEICYTSVTLPKMLVNFLAENKTISFTGCAVQMYFLFVLASTECFLLAAMAYDRYVAICHPLRYKLIMSRELSLRLVTGSLTVNMPVHVVQVYLLFTLPFCGSHEINHFFCDLSPLLELACAEIFVNEVYLFAATTVILILPFFLIVASYVKIISAILKMPSAEGRKKVFATCSSHLIMVSLFYGSATIVYLSPRSKETMDINKLLSLFYTILIPMFNPIVYSLRNREVKVCLKKLFDRKV
ncbi:PREDICTED: olfactory receptor 10A7-like [Gekko japonicus]|uniref:Olfactory receptor n=1 Tax=Gekko japonicus TaxID=146911 RepID=A0ABM1KNN3_GEKJA|nr:PREDICTED: olfactory receptor 10A7-like [Gekko japonicus]